MHTITLAGLFKTIILLGIVQGFIVGILLFFSRRRRGPNRLLSVLLWLMSLASFNLYGYYVNWFDSPLMGFLVNIIPMIIVMPFGPLIYFYVRSSLDPAFALTKKQRVHFYPVIIDLVPYLTAIGYILAVVNRWIRPNPGPVGLFIDTYNIYSDIPRWISVSTYVWLSARYLSELKKKDAVQDVRGVYGPDIAWLRQFIWVFMVFQAIWLIYLIPYVIPRYNQRLLNTVGWYPVYIPLAILTYWLGLKGYSLSQQEKRASKKVPGGGSALPAGTVVKTMELLHHAMEADKLYLQSDLILPMLAEQIGIPQKTISAVLNQHMHKSFNEFVNAYRVEAFKEKILQPETDHLTIAGIALECGFNSQATFQRTFRELTGKSPSEYRKDVSKPVLRRPGLSEK
jgi:AraC-like DNA-binding protein